MQTTGNFDSSVILEGYKEAMAKVEKEIEKWKAEQETWDDEELAVLKGQLEHRYMSEMAERTVELVSARSRELGNDDGREEPTGAESSRRDGVASGRFTLREEPTGAEPSQGDGVASGRFTQTRLSGLGSLRADIGAVGIVAGDMGIQEDTLTEGDSEDELRNWYRTASVEERRQLRGVMRGERDGGETATVTSPAGVLLEGRSSSSGYWLSNGKTKRIGHIPAGLPLGCTLQTTPTDGQQRRPRVLLSSWRAWGRWWEFRSS